GGGIKEIDDIKKLVAMGIEKIALNTQAVQNPELITQAAKNIGSQSIVVSIDVKKSILGKYRVYFLGGSQPTDLDPIEMALRAERAGAGEILINSIDQDGRGKGYDLDLIKSITATVDIPVIACGGAGKIEDLAAAIQIGGASAVAAGSLFVFQGIHRAILISYIESDQLQPYLA
ncbi:MAG: HisA/HisF-related TIM barrel protein, partial [Methylococcaceae bacterium]|nr:HisA/HisF-related TIM barrel protein [Methylococcaceae bacterium]